MEKTYSVSKAAEILDVSCSKIYGWLSKGFENDLIPLGCWYRLPNGHIRIKKWLIKELEKRIVNLPLCKQKRRRQERKKEINRYFIN